MGDFFKNVIHFFMPTYARNLRRRNVVVEEQLPEEDVVVEREVLTPTVKPLFRITQVVWFIFGLLEALLAFRFVLRLLGANPAAGFTSFIAIVTQPFVQPFVSVFRTSFVVGSSVEWTTLLAMFVYWLLAWAIVHLVTLGRPVTTNEARQALREQDAL
jgi:hypothetical protein